MVKRIVCFLCYLTIFFGVCFGNQPLEPQSESKKDSIFFYQTKESDIHWTETSRHLWKWLMAQTSKNVVTFCSSDTKINTDCTLTTDNENIGRPLIPIDMPAEGTFVTFHGSLDKERLPKGQGKFEESSTKLFPVGVAEPWFKLQPGITGVSGKFKKGQPEGKGLIKYTDGSTLQGTFLNGRINGKARLFTGQDKLVAVGLYQQGLPHGPFWIYSYHHDQFAQVHFKNGQLVPENTLLVDYEAKWAHMGSLVNNSFLENAKKVDLDWMAEYNCLQVMRIPQIDMSRDTIAHEKKAKEPKIQLERPLRLPFSITIQKESHQIIIKSAKMLYFNRVAKTGSQSFTHLLIKQGEKLGFNVWPKIVQSESLVDTPEGLADEIASVIKAEKPTVFVRHYSFIDFEKNTGSTWSPDWFNIVRDPIDKIVSWFYYWRAAWNIVSRHKAFPDEPLPSMEFLQKDFDTCVLTNDPECQYVQDSDNKFAQDHRGQMMQFCGHDPICRKFNNAEALQLAKSNVEKHYAVVGTTENINMTLAVLEDRMPEYFKNAAEVYHGDSEVKRFRMKNAYKLPVSDKVMKIVRANFTHEIEFYEFCKQRLQKQFDEIPVLS